MTNRDLYRKTFSQVHSSREIRWEDMSKKKKKRVSAHILMLVAIIAALCVLTAGTTYFLGLADLLLPKPADGDVSESSILDLSSDVPDIISLSGYMNSPEGQALGEWQSFLNSYDVDHRILDAVGNTLDPALEKYFYYYVYSQEMGDKLDEICAKYHLKLHTDRIDLSTHPEALDSCQGYLGTNITAYPQYMYEDGTFSFDAEAVTPDYRILNIQFRRSVKGTFHEVVLNVTNATEFQQWEYRTACGVTVVLALNSEKGLVLADLPDCFVTVNVLLGREQGVEQDDLEALADSIDYTKLSPVVPPEIPAEITQDPQEEPVLSAEESSAPTEKAATAREYFAQALKSFYYDGVFPNGDKTDQYGSGPLSDDNRFAVQDVDGDGEEELIMIYSTGITASQIGYVLAYDPDYAGSGAPLRVELVDFPLFTFYAGGAAEVGLSHNQGLAGDVLWPYDLYVYDLVLDRYGKFASVDAWNKALSETNRRGEPFPDDIDADGDGVVYYVNIDESLFTMDGASYREWREGVIGNTAETIVDYQPLDIDHINRLLEDE